MRQLHLRVALLEVLLEVVGLPTRGKVVLKGKVLLEEEVLQGAWVEVGTVHLRQEKGSTINLPEALVQVQEVKRQITAKEVAEEITRVLHQVTDNTKGKKVGHQERKVDRAVGDRNGHQAMEANHLQPMDRDLVTVKDRLVMRRKAKEAMDSTDSAAREFSSRLSNSSHCGRWACESPRAMRYFANGPGHWLHRGPVLRGDAVVD